MLTKGCTQLWDIQWIVASILARLAELNCLWWVEWLPSESNPADPFSRFAPQDFTNEVSDLPISDNCYPKADLRATLDRI